MSRDLTIDPDAPIVDRPVQRRLGHRRRLAACLVLVACVAGFVGWQRRTPGNEAIDGSRVITADQLEEEYGVRLGVIGLLASGGLVELKFQVTDADKATGLFGSVEDMPVLAVEGTEHVLQSAKGMKHNMRILEGATYFFLYTNVANALHAGSEVSFVINGWRVPDLVVQQ